MRSLNAVSPFVLVVSALAGVACGKDTAVETPLQKPPVVVDHTAIRVVATQSELGTVVGEAFSFDVLAGSTRFTDPRQTGLRYEVEIFPPIRGLSLNNGVISGIPETTGAIITYVRAIDTTGQYAQTQFPIFVFGADLTAPSMPVVPYAYTDSAVPFPQFFANSPTVQRADNMPASNVVTDAGAALGRVLFYDRRLSVNDRASCASCHLQQYAFSDTALLSRGFDGNVTARHSMALVNVRFYRPAKFFRDERAASLEELVLQPISDNVELGLRSDLIAPKLRLAPFYRPLFKAAFGSEEITNERVALALSQFVRALASKNSKFDRYGSGAGEQFNDMENEGERIFTQDGGCRQCHESFAFVSDTARNNGLDVDLLDHGAGAGKFKAPSLRNVMARTSFMHDGRFRTIEQVIDFYDHQVNKSDGLDRLLANLDGTPRRLNLTDYQKRSLKAFLETLTDPTFLADPRFSDVFR